MLRVIGAVMIILAGGALGFIKADALKKRVESIGKIITGLNLLETDIGYGKKDLAKALFAIGKSQGIDLFLKSAKGVGEKGIKDALFAALSEEEYLRPQDRDPISELGEILGMTDADSQTKAIKRALSVLSELKCDAEEEYKRLGRLYRQSGVLGGILGAVILI